MKVIEAPFKKLVEDAEIPAYAHGPEEDAGMDLRAVHDATLHYGHPTLVKTGLAIELPPGYEAQIRPRSGLALAHGITVLNAPGTIDPSYRGEIGVILMKLAGAEPFEVKKGDRIAQMVIAEYAGVQPKAAKKLRASKRGAGGFGSTGV